MALSSSGVTIPVVGLPDFQRLLSDLVAIPSISSPQSDWDQSNVAVVEELARWFDQLGFNCEILPVDAAGQKVNLIATLGEGEEGLVLSGHTDTVPYDSKRWLADPFKLAMRDERFYGLGTCDMKGFFPIIIEALRKLEGAELAQPLVILATADEESSMSGARALANSGRSFGRAAVIGEPTSIRPVRLHKGIMMESLRVAGRSGHSSNPQLGNNAIEGMHQFLAELLAFRQDMQRQHRNPLFEVDVPTLNLGRIHGGDSPNRICAHCELSFDLRPLPGMSSTDLRNAIQARLGGLAESLGLEISLQSLIEAVEPFETQADAELVRICEALTASSAQAVAFATEAPWLQKMGLETIVMGAGSIDQAHQPNEYLACDQIAPMARVLRELITHYCVTTN